MKKFKIVMPLMLLSLGACDLYEESWSTKQRVQVAEERYYEQIPVSEFTFGKISEIASHFTRYGDGTLILSVTYDPASRTYTSLRANSDVKKFTKAFHDKGIKNLKADALPLQGNGENVLVSYTSYKAEAPPDCRTMQGFEDKTLESDPDYPLGCTVETLFARQIARPKDLKGNDDMPDTTDGRRTGNVVEGYRDGIPNKPLEGEQATKQ